MRLGRKLNVAAEVFGRLRSPGAEENPVRVVDVFADELDFGALGLRGVDLASTGRPVNHPVGKDFSNDHKEKAALTSIDESAAFFRILGVSESLRK